MKIGSVFLTASVTLMLVGGCSILGIGCEEEVEREINDLKQIVPALLPRPIAANLEEGNDCDSGSGGYLSFAADMEENTDQIIQPFLSKGWRKIDPTRDKVGGTFINGVTIQQDGKDINLVISEAQDSPKMDIFVEFGG
ncbi:hypothetical protein [Nonomuraea jabiensis]|uniref:hypothetical protein n=1 Tax=Nonomuraea jabiensis TaxID=882448 RepID=UPI003D705A48